MEGLPALILWETIMRTFQYSKRANPIKKQLAQSQATACSHNYMGGLFNNIVYVPRTLPLSDGIGRLVTFEDNDAVIKICIKGRSPNLRHVNRTHRVDLDWLHERIQDFRQSCGLDVPLSA